MYWTDDVADKIQRADADGSNVEDVLTGLNQPTGLDIDTVHGKIYWTNRQQIQRANLDGTNIETLYTDSVNTFDIKVDPGGGNIYWTHDNGNSRVMRANLDGSGVTTINNSMNRPSYFTLAPTQNNIYYTNYGDGSVTRTSINGSSLMTLTTGPTGAVGNAVDLTNGRLYWSGGASNDWIRSANLDGSNVQTIVNGLNAPQDIAYDSDHDRIYWVDALNHVVQRANADGSNVETIVGGLGRPRGIVVVSAAAVPPTGGGSGGGGGGGPVCNGTFRDEFNSTNYTGNDGTLTWTGDWQEVNESDGPQRGDEQVAPDPTAWSTPGTDQARVRNSAEGLQRELDLTGAGTATLSLYYRRNYLDSSSDYVSVQMSSNGTAGPWTEVARFQGGGTDQFYIPISTDVSAFISATTAIRLISSPTLGSRDDVWFDNIQIQCTP